MNALAPLALLASLLTFAFRQGDPLVGDGFVYVTYLGEEEVGRETVALASDGWSSEGSYDFMGIRKGRFHATLRHGEDNQQDYRFTSDEGGKEQSLRAVYAGENWTVTDVATAKERARGIGSQPVFVYDDLLWASLIDLGRWLVGREAANELPAGARITALTGVGAVGFPVEFVDAAASEQILGGEPVALRIYRVMLAGAVGVTLICTPDGLPLRIEIPTQRIRVEIEGLGSVHGPVTTPTSLVDAGPWRETLSQPTFEVAIERDVEIEMRDGVKLVADVYLPVIEGGGGKVPTVLARTPYNRISEGALKGGWFARRGYAFVAEDVRGRFESGGEWLPLMHETHDGSDTIDWIAKQGWSDGKVGMLGASYVGLVQWLAAKSGNPHLVCIVPQVSPPDPQENFPYEGGTFMLSAGWWARVLEAMDTGKSWSEGVDFEKAFGVLPLGDLDQALDLTEQRFLDTWLAHPPHDIDYWEPSSYQGSFERMSVPAMHITGWWDGDQPGALQNFPAMRRRAKTELARDGQFLVVGPWTHLFNSARAIGQVDYGDEAIVDLDARILRFFDRYLKGIENGIESEPPVLTFTMGTNRWHAEANWPLPQTSFTKLHLASGGHATKRGGDGRLALAAGGAGTPSDSYRYDPTALPELDIDFTDISGAEATEDKSGEPDRDDDLEFTSPPLASACEIVGPIEVVLWVSSDAADTDFSASLMRVTAKGEYFVIRDGVQRLRYAADPRRDSPVPPGTIAKVTIDCWATGMRLEKGDRLMLTVSSWVWPAYGRNLNTLESQATAKDSVVATNTIYHDSAHPSHLLLPVVPREDAPGLSFVE
jgi:putative CocE/NonD family hydrolase